MSDILRTAELFDCGVPYLRELFASSGYPWDMLPRIKDWIRVLIDRGLDGFTEWQPGVWIGKDVSIAPTVVAQGPAIIGDGCELRPGAFLRGNVICGRNCVLGNSCEFKNCILLDGVQCPHYNYVGDSILGNRAHTGAGTICSNLKSDGKNVVVHGEADYETGLRKLGGILADGADVGCSCVLNPGTVIGKHTSVYPMTALRGVYPAGCIVKSADNVVVRR